jgi:uncharacterized tellurite resistance protein B-like protein
MDLSEFSEAQRIALLDLLVLAMYLDRHLGADEDARVKRLLVAMGAENPYDRERLFRDSVNRVRPHADNPETVQRHSVKLARLFTTQDQCRQVCALLEELIACDGHVTESEKRFMDGLRDSFQV